MCDLSQPDFSRDVEKEAWLADGLRELSEAGELSEVGELEEHFFAKVNSGESEWL
ncbi:MAG: hypothetical protein JO235_11730 [Chroococcidiopsidaceae cyanobacterium CP_BM_RX_35]|nr:hypothetical protein [Chroococcidiopsidaceae cyanobacterium CP_BM_RX_35]